jgi:hypothetical protein
VAQIIRETVAEFEEVMARLSQRFAPSPVS